MTITKQSTENKDRLVFFLKLKNLLENRGGSKEKKHADPPKGRDKGAFPVFSCKYFEQKYNIL